MKHDNLRERTSAMALRIVRLAESLPKSRSADVMARQLLRSGTSVAANYRAACRAKSKNDFIFKLGIVEEECDESLFWMELLIKSGFVKDERIADLVNETSEILKIVVTSRKTAKSR
ncbi:four helix bundle protein [bacterium]|nr:four helix bundle protein [bacterium]